MCTMAVHNGFRAGGRATPSIQKTISTSLDTWSQNIGLEYEKGIGGVSVIGELCGDGGTLMYRGYSDVMGGGSEVMGDSNMM